MATAAYDLVVCDLSVADLDGHAVYRAIEGQPPPRPAVVFVTGTEARSHTDWLGTANAPGGGQAVRHQRAAGGGAAGARRSLRRRLVNPSLPL
jgi:CheY-like chemotaxis protein